MTASEGTVGQSFDLLINNLFTQIDRLRERVAKLEGRPKFADALTRKNGQRYHTARELVVMWLRQNQTVTPGVLYIMSEGYYPRHALVAAMVRMEREGVIRRISKGVYVWNERVDIDEYSGRKLRQD